jgi:hypothetical protein
MCLALLFSGVAYSATQDEKCANSINKGAAKLAKAYAGDAAACIKNAGKGKTDKLGNGCTTASCCLTADAKNKVAKAVTKIKVGDCPSGAPAAIPGLLTDANDINAVMLAKEPGLIAAIFGADLDSVVVLSDKEVEGSGDAAKCQAAVIKAVGKCQDVKLSSFNACKKTGLKEGTITNAGELVTLCMTPEIHDPKGKIAMKCGGDFDLAKKCGTTDNDALFPGCAVPDRAACIDHKIECEVCKALNDLDGLSRDCDEFDNGVLDGSCDGAGPVCGDNSVNRPEEACDGIDDDACPGDCIAPGQAGECTCAVAQECGNNVTEGTEHCDGDDANACPGQCIAPGQPNECTCPSDCGNGIRESTEECDGSDADLCHEPDECQADCTCVVSSSTCGNGVLDGMEQCDGSDAGACPGNCLPSCRCPACATGEIWNSETCGGGCPAGLSCESPHHPGFPPQFDGLCRCIAADVCGNTILEWPEETCEGEEFDYSCPGLCQPDCTCRDAVCGNGVRESNRLTGVEACDPPEDEECPGDCQDCKCPVADGGRSLRCSCPDGSTLTHCFDASLLSCDAACASLCSGVLTMCGNLTGQCICGDGIVNREGEQCDGADDAACPGTCLGDCSCPRRVFVTSQSYDGNLGGLAGGEAKCQALADAAALGGEYKAWLALTGGASPSTTFEQASVPYVLVDGTLIANDWADLTDGTPLPNLINLTETGASEGDLGFKWTNVKADGTAGIGPDCDGWMSNSNLDSGKVGTTSFEFWTDASSTDCASEVHLYCFED